jgi:bacteriocin biosynthesis cyclodehydratase domain-containing protein
MGLARELDRPHEATAADNGSFVANDTVRVVRCGAASVLIKHGTRSDPSVLLTDPTGRGVLAKLLAGPEIRSVEGLIAAGEIAPEDAAVAQDLTAELLELGLLVRPGSDPITMLLALEGDDDIGPAAASVLGSRTLTLVGAGLVLEELRRQVDEWPLGAIEIARLDRSPDAASTEIAQAFASADLVAVCTDRFEPAWFHRANQAALATGTTWLLGHLDGARALVGPAFVPGETACYLELEALLEATLNHRNDYRLLRHSTMNGAPRTVVPRFHASLCAAWLAAGLLPLATRGDSFLVGRLVATDLAALAIDGVDVAKLPRCPACYDDALTRRVSL